MSPAPLSLPFCIVRPSANVINSESTSPLHDATILRFAHAFESGGGTERYLDDLDRAMLERNALTVVRLHLTRARQPARPTEERVGQGTLIRVPLVILPENSQPTPAADHAAAPGLKQRLRDRLLYHPLVWRSLGARWVKGYKLTPQPGQAAAAGEAAADVFRSRRIDLAMLHFFGGADADEVIAAAKSAGVPIALLNHYSNDRFLHLAIRKHAMDADAVAGVNGLEVPPYLGHRFTNLSDGIDTAFFSRAHARPLADAPRYPIILLPARVVREKGQLDLVRAVARLREFGVECCIAFAGRVDSSDFGDELRREIAQNGLTDRVHFLGGLDLEALRDWYAASTVVAFPTYHHEGLGRVTVEAQAMGTPVVAYATGGVADGVIEGQTGFLLRTGDIEGMVSRLRELLRSPALRATMRTAGRQLAEARFSLRALAERHEQFCQRVIQTKLNRHSP